MTKETTIVASSAPESRYLPSMPTPILSLPTELVDLILSSCTNSALLALSQTCTSLHAIALHTFFQRNNIRDPANGWLSAYEAPRETLDAIRVALFVKKLSMVNWYFNPGWECNICSPFEEVVDADKEGMCSCRSKSGLESRTAISIGPLNRTFDEVASLSAIVSHLEDVGSVYLHFSVVDMWLTPARREMSRGQVDRDPWARAFLGLLDEVLDKGCRILHVLGGDKLKDLYRDECLNQEFELVAPATMQGSSEHTVGVLNIDNHPIRQDRNHSRKRLLERIFRLPLRRIMALVHRIAKESDKSSLDNLESNSKSARQRSTRKSLKLEELHVHDMLLLPPFHDWTLSLLTSSACASALTRLSFRPYTISMPSPFLNSLSLPNLIEFEITSLFTIPRNGRETGQAKFEDVAGFLGRHSRGLKKVHLYGVEAPVSDREGVLESTRFGLCKPIFPLLESITAHPAYIMWLVELAVSSEHSPPTPAFHSSRHNNKTLGNLKSIGITSEHYNSEPYFEYPLFDRALGAVIRFCRWRNGERDPRTGNKKLSSLKKNQEKPIELTLVFASERGVGEWFASHLISSQEHATNQTNSESPLPLHVPPASVVTQLTHISLLTISTFYSVKLSESTMDSLPEWLALVSNSSGLSSGTPGTPSTLQLVKFPERPFRGFPDDEDLFVKRVAEKCVGLKWMQLGIKAPVDLDKVRAEAGTEDINGSGSGGQV